MPTVLEFAGKMLRGEAPPPPVGRLLGFVLKAVEPGRAVFELRADERHHNPMGTLHGGIFCDLADAAMGYAYAATLTEGESFTTALGGIAGPGSDPAGHRSVRVGPGHSASTEMPSWRSSLARPSAKTRAWAFDPA